MKKTNLGKGLSELLGGSEEFKDLQTSNSNKLTEIKIDSIIAGKYQPRTTINQLSLTELTESIKEKGVLQPIVVNHNNAFASFTPNDKLIVDAQIDFKHQLIGKQKMEIEINYDNFLNEISNA